MQHPAECYFFTLKFMLDNSYEQEDIYFCFVRLPDSMSDYLIQ